MKPSIRGVFVVVLFAFGLATAQADDGGISYGGLPRLLTGHPTVSMQNEVVHMTVGSDAVRVDCQFVFVNDGPACTVRMGFPDQGRGANDPDEDGDMSKHPKGTFLSYVSYVDGARVPTELVRAAHPGNFWHAKVVRFGAHETRRVRDVYTVPVGGGIVGGAPEGSVSEASYILHTGASWHGPIGRGTIWVTFSPQALSLPLRVRQAGVADQAAWQKWAPGTVTYTGPRRPTVQGRTLRFDFANLEPTQKDDIDVTFGFKRLSSQ